MSVKHTHGVTQPIITNSTTRHNHVNILFPCLPTCGAKPVVYIALCKQHAVQCDNLFCTCYSLSIKRKVSCSQRNIWLEKQYLQVRGRLASSLLVPSVCLCNSGLLYCTFAKGSHNSARSEKWLWWCLDLGISRTRMVWLPHNSGLYLPA